MSNSVHDVLTQVLTGLRGVSREDLKAVQEQIEKLQGTHLAKPPRLHNALIAGFVVHFHGGALTFLLLWGLGVDSVTAARFAWVPLFLIFGLNTTVSLAYFLWVSVHVSNLNDSIQAALVRLGPPPSEKLND